MRVLLISIILLTTACSTAEKQIVTKTEKIKCPVLEMKYNSEKLDELAYKEYTMKANIRTQLITLDLLIDENIELRKKLKFVTKQLEKHNAKK